jgi:hypothetical protein
LFLLFVSSSLTLAFRYSFLFVPEMSTSFTSYVLQIISITLVWIL